MYIEDKVNQYHHQHINNDFGQKQICMLGLVFHPAGGIKCLQSSCQIRKCLLQIFPPARPEKFSQAGRGSYIKSVSAQLALCLVSGMEDPPSF